MPSRLPVALLVLRLSLVVFFAVWAVEKLVKPEAAIAIAGAFYGVELTTMMAYLTGAVQIVMLALFAAGIARTASYGFFLLIHTVSVLSSYEQMLNPYQSYNHLFQAGLPTLAALVALFMLRDQDRLLTLRRS